MQALLWLLWPLQNNIWTWNKSFKLLYKLFNALRVKQSLQNDFLRRILVIVDDKITVSIYITLILWISSIHIIPHFIHTVEKKLVIHIVQYTSKEKKTSLDFNNICRFLWSNWKSSKYLKWSLYFKDDNKGKRTPQKW